MSLAHRTVVPFYSCAIHLFWRKAAIERKKLFLSSLCVFPRDLSQTLQKYLQPGKSAWDIEWEGKKGNEKSCRLQSGPFSSSLKWAKGQKNEGNEGKSCILHSSLLVLFGDRRFFLEVYAFAKLQHTTYYVEMNVPTNIGILGSFDIMLHIATSLPVQYGLQKRPSFSLFSFQTIIYYALEKI